MEVAQAAATYLGPISEAFTLVGRKVHPVWFPYAWAPTLHAARVSMIFQANARRSITPLSWGQYIAGYLIMAWGGGTISHLLLGLPPPMLYSIHPTINYLSLHLLCTVIFSLFPSLLNPALLDTILWPLDAVLRTNAVVSALALFSHPSVAQEYKTSTVTHLIIGAIASAGGGVSLGTIGGFTSNWTFGTPPFLRAGAGWAGTLDIWGGALIALIYSSLIGDPTFDGVKTYANLALSASPTSAFRKPRADANIPPLAPLAAKAIAGVVLGGLFAARTIQTHWTTTEPKASVKPTATVNPPRTPLMVDVPSLPTPSSPAPKTRKRKTQASKNAT